MSSGRRHIREMHRFTPTASCQICHKVYKNERQRNEHLNTTHGKKKNNHAIRHSNNNNTNTYKYLGVSAKQMLNVIKVPPQEESAFVFTAEGPEYT